MRKLLVTLGILAAALAWFQNPSELHAQGPGQPPSDNKETSSQEDEGNRPWWEADLPGGNYLVALSAIRQVSTHQYVVDGVARVWEVTIATDTSSIARFYFLEEITQGGNIGSVLNERLKQVGQLAGERAGTGEVWKEVIKNYPHSTHAHTVEYRLQYKEDLDSLYGSVKRAWMRGRGVKFTIKAE